MVGELLVAWIGLPILAVVISVGLALLLERLTGYPLGVLRVPVGLCSAVCLTLGVYWLKGPAAIAVAVLLLGALAGLVLGKGELVRMRPGWLSLAWIVAYCLHLAPVLLSGEAAWAGYNFVNDTATQMVLAEYVSENGLGRPEGTLLTTAGEFVRGYLSNSYPVGSHALLGTLDEVAPGRIAGLYQPYIAVLMASAAMALAQLGRRAGLPVWAAAAAGVAAVGANLLYQYALQGNVKEMAFLMAFVTAAAVGRELIGADRPLRASPAAAICFAAAFNVYSVAAAPYLVALGVVLVAAALWLRERPPVKRLAVAGAALLVTALVLALPGLSGALTFNEVASSVFSGAAREADFGQLLRPLDLLQVAGVWLTGDYRLPVPAGRELITVAFCLLVGLLAVAGVVTALRRREPASLLLLVSTVLAGAYLLPRLSPYADGKVLALASPVMVFGAAVGTWGVARFSPAVAAVLAVVVALGVLWSDAFAYHVVRIAPTDRLDALEEVGERLDDAEGLVLVNEPEEFAKVYRGGANFNTPTEAFTPEQVQLRTPQSFLAFYFDLDYQLTDYVQKFPTIVKRRSPDASRPPANYRLAFANEWYEAWRKQAGPKVFEHLPLQGVHQAAVKPRCSDVLAMARRARRGERLVAARTPPQVAMDTVRATRSPSWGPHPTQPGMVIPSTPGRATDTVTVTRPGRYRAWVAGSLGRPVTVRVDGRTIGAAEGVNNLGQWLPAGEVRLQPGSHRLQLERGGGGVKPGDGYVGEVGPLVLEAVDGQGSLHSVAPERARELCGQEWDWIERVGT